MDTKAITNSIASLVINKPKDIDSYSIHFDTAHLNILMSKGTRHVCRVVPYTYSIAELELCIKYVHQQLLNECKNIEALNSTEYKYIVNDTEVTNEIYNKEHTNERNE